MSSTDNNIHESLKKFDNKVQLIVLIAIVVLSALLIKSWIKGKNDGVEVQAIITNIEYSSGRIRTRIPYYEYEYKGKKYENIRGTSADVSDEIGDEVTITIDPDKPTDIYNTSTSSLVYVVIFVIFAFFFLRQKKE